MFLIFEALPTLVSWGRRNRNETLFVRAESELTRDVERVIAINHKRCEAKKRPQMSRKH